MANNLSCLLITSLQKEKEANSGYICCLYAHNPSSNDVPNSIKLYMFYYYYYCCFCLFIKHLSIIFMIVRHAYNYKIHEKIQLS